MPVPPPRVAVIGIDGSGKSSTALRAIQLLASDVAVCKPGRNPFAIRDGVTTECVPRLARFFESLFQSADGTRRRALIGLSRLLFVLYQGWLEPFMIRRFQPDLILNTRCMIVDPAIYVDFYYPRLAKRLPLGMRLRLSRFLSRLDFSDLYVLLDTPPATAMERIHRRIEKSPEAASQPRDYWLHLHEQEGILAGIGEQFPQCLAAARDLATFEVIGIDTTSHGEEEVAAMIANHARALLRRTMKVGGADPWPSRESSAEIACDS